MGRLEFDFDREADLREQYKEYMRAGYDGHNRHSGLTTMGDLRTRRSRRSWNSRMRVLVSDWNYRLKA